MHTQAKNFQYFTQRTQKQTDPHVTQTEGTPEAQTLVQCHYPLHSSTPIIQPNEYTITTQQSPLKPTHIIPLSSSQYEQLRKKTQ